MKKMRIENNAHHFSFFYLFFIFYFLFFYLILCVVLLVINVLKNNNSNLKMATGIARSVTGAPDGYRDIIKLQFNPTQKNIQNWKIR